MPLARLPLRYPRTVARDIPGVLDVLFPRLSGGLVGALNKRVVQFEGIEPVSEKDIASSALQNAMLFELSMVRAERSLNGESPRDWDECLKIALKRQSRHFDAELPKTLSDADKSVATHAAENLIAMINVIRKDYPDEPLEQSPPIPGLGWIASGNADLSIGALLIEVKHTGRNFISGDFRQVLMYWLLKYAYVIESKDSISDFD